MLDKLNLRPALLPICSKNVGALDYPETSSEISALLAKQMASPVEFIRQIENQSKGYGYLLRSVLDVRLLALFGIFSINVHTLRSIQIIISVVILKVPLMLWPRFLLRGE